MNRKLENGCLILQLETDLTAAKVKDLIFKTQEFLSSEEEYNCIVLDFSKIQYVDSIGVTFVVQLYKTAKNAGKEFKLTHVGKDIIQLFQLIKLDSLFEIGTVKA